MKNLIFVFALVVMVGLVGCATTGKGQRASTEGSKVSQEVSQGNLQQMTISCFGFCSIKKENSK